MPLPTGPVLAIETSCDETAVALADEEGGILSSEVASQVDIHAPYGGVVPELASRNHNLWLRPLIARTLEQAGVAIDSIGAVAATSGPGLASSLLIGDTTGKAIAAALDIPFFSINHLEGHLLSPFIGSTGPVPRHVALIVSGGHTLLVEAEGVAQYRLLGTTKDDAAGEAFDKAGKMLGLPYPGGPEIDRLAREGNPEAFRFPRSMLGSGDFAFSFSGLKTSVYYLLEKRTEPPRGQELADICASFQAAVVEVLVRKLVAAAEQTGTETVAVSGGVSCNRGLREAISVEAQANGLSPRLASPAHSTDNAAMIAFAAAMRRREGIASSPLDADIDPNLALA